MRTGSFAKCLAVGALLWGLSTAAHAAVDLSNFLPVDEIIKVIDSIENGLKAATHNGALTAMGLQLLAFFVLLNFVWAVVIGMATGSMLDRFLGDILPMGVGAVAAWFFIGNGTGVIDLGGAITSFVDAIGSAVAPSTYNGGHLSALIGRTIYNIFSVLWRIWDIDMASSAAGIGSFLTAGLAIVMSFILKILTIVVVGVILMVACGSFIATIILTQVTIYIALIFMPIMVPFMIFKPLESFFSQWLSFLVTAALAKVIGALIITLTDPIITSMVTTSKALRATVAATGASSWDALVIDITIYMAMILMSLIVYLMVSRIDSIAKALGGGAIATNFKGAGREFHGGLGGVGKPSIGSGGSKMGGPTPGNAAAKFTTYMPNVVKPVTNAVGGVVSRVAGAKMARNDVAAHNEQRNSFVGPQQDKPYTLGRDTSQMSAATARAYTRELEKVNERQASQGARNYVHTPSVSSTNPKHRDNAT